LPVDEERVGDVLLEEQEAFVVLEMLDVLRSAADVVVHGDDLVAARKQCISEM
jgi:hypothetical protein